MQTIQTRERSGTDGTLTVCVPLGRPDTEFDVVLVVQPKAAASGPLPYYGLIGSIDDDTFVVPPQPPLPPPIDIE
jgi:hypothetical protein